jgi:hypothetical protein
MYVLLKKELIKIIFTHFSSYLRHSRLTLSEIIGAVCADEREHKNKQCEQQEGIFSMQQVVYVSFGR